MNRFDPIRPTSSRFTLDSANKKIFGVCSGSAAYLGVDVTLVRIAFALGALLGFGSLFIVYIAIAMIAD